MTLLPLVLAVLALVACVALAVSAMRTYAQVSAVRRVQVPVRVLASRDVQRDRIGQVGVGPVKVGLGAGRDGNFRHELELEYPGPDGRPLVTRKVTSYDHAIRSGGRVGPEFDGHSVWVDPQNPTDVAFAPTGDKGLVVVKGVLSGICGVGAFVAVVFGLLASLWGDVP